MENIFDAHNKFMIKDSVYMIRKTLGSNIEIENLDYKKIEIWEKSDLLDAWVTGELTFKYKNENHATIPQQSFLELEESQKETAVKWFNILKPIIDKEVSTTELQVYLDSLDPPVKLPTYYFWKKRWDEFNDLRALTHKKRGPRKPSTSENVLKIIDGVIEDTIYEQVKYTVEAIYSEVLLCIDEENEFKEAAEKISYPSRSTIYRRVKAILDVNRKNTLKYGTVQGKLMTEGVKGEINVSRPLQRVEIDWTPVDVLLIDTDTLKPKRTNLVYAIDKFTSYPLGFFLANTVDIHAVKQCLLHAIMPKTYLKDLYSEVEGDWLAFGIPHTLVVDNASVNNSIEFEEICLQLGIRDLQFCAVEGGHQKGTIERAFNNLNTQFVHGLKGTTFSNFIEKGKYDSVKNACITPQGFIYMAHLAMVDLIAHRFNARKRKTPHKLWEESLYKSEHLKVQLPNNINDLKILLMAGSATRKIVNKGVTIENEYYTSYELMELRNYMAANQMNEEVRVRYDLSDMRNVYVYDKYNKKYIIAKETGMQRKKIDTSFPVPYLMLELDSKLATEEKKSVDPKLLGRTKRKIKKIEDNERKKVLRLKREEKQNKINTEGSYNYIGMAVQMGLENTVPHPDPNIRLKIKEDDNTIKSDNNLKNTVRYQSVSHDIDIDALPDWEVVIKTGENYE